LFTLKNGAAHRIQVAWENEISGARITRKENTRVPIFVIQKGKKRLNGIYIYILKNAVSGVPA
jgi:hypothetical protein